MARLIAPDEPVPPRGRIEQPVDVAAYQASAQAALMLIESLTLALLERGVLDRDEVLDAVENVIETKRMLHRDGENAEIAEKAIGLLSTLANSLAAQAPHTAATPPA